MGREYVSVLLTEPARVGLCINIVHGFTSHREVPVFTFTQQTLFYQRDAGHVLVGLLSPQPILS